MSLFDEQVKVVKMLLGKSKWWKNHDNIYTCFKVALLKQESESQLEQFGILSMYKIFFTLATFLSIYCIPLTYNHMY